jgi:DNA-directed RNA polymerase specialized sigma24 family protein
LQPLRGDARILIRARRKRGPRRGGDRQRVDPCRNRLQPRGLAEHDEVDVSEALDKLANANPKLAEFFKLVRYGGLTIKEAAAVLGVCERTGKTYWKMSKAWLRTELEGPG